MKKEVSGKKTYQDHWIGTFVQEDGFKWVRKWIFLFWGGWWGEKIRKVKCIFSFVFFFLRIFSKIFFKNEVLFGINFNIVKGIILLSNCTSRLQWILFF